ncbi:MAG: aminotransferase class I/II-fold pyridoxal phosphate-dependent enzyme [Ilumatobacteraceae bacterium]
MSRSLEAAARAAAVPPFRAMAMAREAVELELSGRRVLHLEVGQPATGAPALARDAVTQLLADGAPLGYTNAPGLPSLRRGIAAHYADWYGVDVDPASILAVGGASAGFTLAFLAAFDAGDRVGILEPGYPCYRNTLLALGVEPVAIPVGPDTRWAPTPELLDAAGPLRGLVVASPSNPTGTVLSLTQQAEIAAWCAARGVQLVADEIYHGITYGTPAATMLSATRDAVVVNSFSKYFSMTGWRLGWMVVPDHLRDAVERLQQNVYICAPHVSQVAGAAALRAGAELDEHVAGYTANRSVLVDGLAAAGIDRIAEADGAFYVYADVGHLTESASELCSRWLHDLGVATTPGLDFDLARGERFVRFSYAGATADMAAACEALAGWRP